jgi:predicted metallopeptidase
VKLNREDLLSLEAFDRQRDTLKAALTAHKKDRTVHLGEHMTLIFEDRQTVMFQIHEMLRIEKTFSAEGIDDELSAYNPLIPDGSNFKATLLIEYSTAERPRALARLAGVEHRIFLEIEGFPRVYAIADEDLSRSTAEKTSAVHFLRFQLTSAMKEGLAAGAQVKLGCDHTEYPQHIDTLPDRILASLLKDLDFSGS